MTYRAAVPIGDSGETVPLANAVDVDHLITLLSRDDAGAATIQAGESDPTLDVQVSEGFGYLYYASDSFTGPCAGDPTSPPMLEESEFGFPEGSGVPMATFRATVLEFVASAGARPSVVDWTPESSSLYR